MKRKLLNIILGAVLLFGAVVFIADLAPALLRLPQRAFNLCYFFGVMPICLGLSDIPRWAHPELFDEGR